jgi:dTDP-4-dehydrorhamnose reductase
MPRKGSEKKPAKELIMIFGKSGWIGGKLGELCEEMGLDYVFAKSRLEQREAVGKELDKVKPTQVINAAGVTGRPNVDWCEDHKVETIRANVLGGLTLADLTNERDIHLTVFATGCIFEYDEDHAEGSGVGFKEDEEPNFFGSFYSHTKAMVEAMIRVYPNVLNLRVRMPVSDDLHPRNFITKISKYERVVNIPNSMTILTDLLPIAIKASQRRIKGVLNFTNPGVISHNEILQLYQDYIDPKFKWKNFTLEEQDKILKSKRSNNELDTELLTKHFPEVQHVSLAMHGVFQRMRIGMGMSPLDLTEKGEEGKKAAAKRKAAPKGKKKASAKKAKISRTTTLAASVKGGSKLRPVSRRSKA